MFPAVLHMRCLTSVDVAAAIYKGEMRPAVEHGHHVHSKLPVRFCCWCTCAPQLTCCTWEIISDAWQKQM